MITHLDAVATLNQLGEGNMDYQFHTTTLPPKPFQPNSPLNEPLSKVYDNLSFYSPQTTSVTNDISTSFLPTLYWIQVSVRMLLKSNIR